jgi:hypothetical protein
MPVVERERRLELLRRLGVSDALVRQSAGEELHPLFWFRCQGPPQYSYAGAACPDGPLLIPLWDCDTSVTGVREQGGGLEFLRFSVEEPGDYRVLARTEQGLWATVFADLYEDRDDLGLEDFREAAHAVGFRYFDRVVSTYEAADVSTFEAHCKWVRQLVDGTDREASGPT